jgi:hypothetical protein
MKGVKAAVIPAAGLGTRFLPATKAMPKEMLPVVDKPAIQFVVEEAVAAGLDDVLFITSRGKRALEDHFDRNTELEVALQEKNDADRLALTQESTDLARIHYVRQGQALGLGHAVLMAENHIGDQPFAVLLGEDLFASALRTVNSSRVGAAVDVQITPADDAPNGMQGNDPSAWQPSNSGDPNATVVPTDPSLPILRSNSLTTGDHQIVAKHHTRVEKMATKVHNRGGVLTIHAYGPDEDLALARASAVRAHLEAQLAKRGHTESSPIWVTYAGNPDHKKDVYVTVHWHPDTNLPGALPGAK